MTQIMSHIVGASNIQSRTTADWIVMKTNLKSEKEVTEERAVLTREQAAKFLKMSVRTLDRRPIPRCKDGRLVRYMASDLSEYLLSKREVPIKSSAPIRFSAKASNRQCRNQKGASNQSTWLEQKMAQLAA